MSLDMVRVASSNLVAPTKFGRKFKHLAETPGAFFSSVGQWYAERYFKRCAVGPSSDSEKTKLSIKQPWWWLRFAAPIMTGGP